MMSLATRCTACGTIFRVVQDQLKVSEGWVRCGRCDAVFNATLSLFDLERDVPPAWPATLPTVANEAASFPQNDHSAASLENGERRALHSYEHEHGHGHGHERGHGQSDRYSDVFAPQQTQPEELPSSAAQLSSQQPMEAELSVAPHGSEPLLPESLLLEPHRDGQSTEFTEFLASELAPSSPDFIRHADKAQRWKSSGARLALAFGVLVVLLALCAQITHHFRDLIAARWPQSKATLVSACAWLPCQVSLPLRIDDLAVESTSLTHTIPGSDAFKLTVNLKNRGHFAVALPSIDLSLTDASGQLLARRALAPSDFLASSAGLASGAETTLNTMLTASDKKVSGYTVEVFYP